MSGPRVIAYGGGIQSTSMLVLAKRKVIDYTDLLFANVGDDSEHPGTLSYVTHIAVPYATHHGLTIHELGRYRRTGERETLLGRLVKPGSRSLPIPVRMPDTGAPGTRSCTTDFKILVLGKWLKAHGASPEAKATVAVGISLDEIHRINARKAKPYEILDYPLVGICAGKTPSLDGLRLRRGDCEQVILDEPLPAFLADSVRALIDTKAPDIRTGQMEYLFAKVTRADLLASDFTRMPRPPKSACYFCPFHRPSEWVRQRTEEPQLFAAAVDLENLLNARRDELGRDHVYLTRFGKPLSEAVPVSAPPDSYDDLDDPSCDNGWCMT